MKRGCAGVDGVDREERISYTKSESNDEIGDKKSSVSFSFFLTHTKSLLVSDQGLSG